MKVDQDQPHKDVQTSHQWSQAVNYLKTKPRWAGNQICSGALATFYSRHLHKTKRIWFPFNLGLVLTQFTTYIIGNLSDHFHGVSPGPLSKILVGKSVFSIPSLTLERLF